MARRKKQQVTYDSQETRTLMGLLSCLTALVLFISAFVEPVQGNLFTEIKKLLGYSTVFTAIFTLNLGLFLLGAKLPFTSRASIFAQVILIFLLPAFLSAQYFSRGEAFAAAETGQSGGTLGYSIAFGLFGDQLIFGQFTPFILGVAIIIFVPVALSMSISQIIDIALKVLAWIFNAIRSLFFPKRNEEESEAKPERAAYFGDFQKLSSKENQSRQNLNLNSSAASNQNMPPHSGKQPTITNLSSQTKVEITEATLDENGLSQSTLKYPNWQLPPSSLLNPYRKVKPKDTDTARNAQIIEQTLESFSIEATVAESYVGPSVVRYAINIPVGTRVDKVINLAPTLALGLGVDAKALRIENIVGTNYLGIEVPRQVRDFVQLREIMESEQMQVNKMMLPVPVGKDIDGDCVVTDVQKMPHLLIAGATGSGKSILTNSFIVSLLMNKTPDELRLILVDPKQVELMDYNGIPHLLTPVIVDMEKVVNALKWAVDEMENRYKVIREYQSQGSSPRNIEDYNKARGFTAMPYIVIVIDEMADMMMTANRVEVENAIVRLTQKARAVGIHLILATQRPSIQVITGLIKANVPARIGMSVASNVDSRVILDSQGAESLMGKGDLLYNSPGVARMMRLQGPNVSGEEISRVVAFIKSQAPEIQYITSILESPVSAEGGELGDISGDDMFAAAVKVVVNTQRGSASYLQRRLNVGFNRAARLLEEMEELGIVGPAQNGGKSRDVLISDAEEFLKNLAGHKSN